jgi:riboflavin biosynthesis pyrimidine reductase
MNPQPKGPESGFVCLIDESVDEGRGLPDGFRLVYGCDWRLPQGDRAYVYSNFVLSRDGRASFNEPGHMSGGEVSGFSGHDRWLMALLRARADAILMGDNTLRIEPDHIWTAEHIFPADAEAFAALRRAERRTLAPLQVFLSLEGDVDVSAAAIFSRDEPVVLATTTRGAALARALPATRARVDVVELGADAVDVGALLDLLYDSYGVATVLCEGGPRAYGSLLATGRLDDEFLTLSPVVVGSAADAPRPGLIEGVTFPATSHPWSRPVTLHRAGDLLFLRSRYAFPSPPAEDRTALES